MNMHPRFVGYMFRPRNDHPYPTAADDQYCRDLAHEIFGTGRERLDTAFCETHAFWWLMICLLCPRLDIIGLLEVWDYRDV